MLIIQALSDIQDNPNRRGSKAVVISGQKFMTYHLKFSREHIDVAVGRIKKPRHIVFYLKQGKSKLEVVRILHEKMEFRRHFPAD